MFSSGYLRAPWNWTLVGAAFWAAQGVVAAPDTSTSAQSFSALFSKADVGGSLPTGWEHVPFNKRKTATQWSLVKDEGQTVLMASAHGSVSMVMRNTSLKLGPQTLVKWRWKIDSHPVGADNSQASKEDSAARLVFVFDGEKSSLPWKDRAVMRMAKTLSGREMPYATLMYVISGVASVNTVVENPHTRRVQMIVASSASQTVGHWVELRRDLNADYRKAFGEAPGRLIAYGVMSDTDNTGSNSKAWYGDIELVSTAGTW